MKGKAVASSKNVTKILSVRRLQITTRFQRSMYSECRFSLAIFIFQLTAAKQLFFICHSASSGYYQFFVSSWLTLHLFWYSCFCDWCLYLFLVVPFNLLFRFLFFLAFVLIFSRHQYRWFQTTYYFYLSMATPVNRI